MNASGKQYFGSLQEIAEQIERHSSAEIDTRLEALRLANGCAGFDNEATITIERAEKYLKFLQGKAPDRGERG